MKTLRLILALLTLTFAITSCQKDVSFEGGNAKGSLGKTTAGDCDPIFVNGLYYKDTVMKASNFVDVQVDFTKIGVYTIKTDTINGYSFIASGSTGTLGPNTIRLFGKGKPLAAGFNIFTVKFDGSQCSFTVSVTAITGGGGGTGAAVYAFGNTAGACSGSVLGGTYTSGVAMLPTNIVTIPVTVSSAGTYTISTTANGVTFSGSGNLTTASTNITLAASNTPTTSGTINYPISSGTTSCSFAVNYLPASTGGGAAVFNFDCPNFTNQIVVNGFYTVGVPMNSTNTIILPISLGTPGNYMVTTNIVNGVSFSGSGTLPMGANSITLQQASGTGTMAGFNTFTPTGAACGFQINFGSAPPTGILTFTSGTTVKTFIINQSADTSILSNTPLIYELQIDGAVDMVSPESISIYVAKPTTFFTNSSSYDINSITSLIDVQVDYTDASGTLFIAHSAVLPQNPSFSVTITSITPTRVKGKFSGTLKNGSTPYLITTGDFDLPLN